MQMLLKVSIVNRLIIIAIILGLASDCYTQNLSSESRTLQISTKKISKNEGLLNQYIRAILQDRRGFLWFGTIEGVYRYDGYSFLNINSAGRKQCYLQNNVVNSLLEDSDGNIWIGTSGGLDKLNFVADTITHFKVNPDLSDPKTSLHKSLNFGEVRDIEQDSTGRIWLALYGGGLNCYNPKNDTFTYYVENKADPKSFKAGLVNGLLLENNGTLWIATEFSGVYRMNVYTDRYPTKIEATKNGTYSSVYKDRKSNYWFGTWGAGLIQFDPVQNTLISNTFGKEYAQNTIRTILEDRSNNFWLGTFRAGLYLYNRDSKTYQTTRTDINSTESIGNNTVWSLFQDQSECIWAGTWGNGLFKFCPNASQFITETSSGKSNLSNITSFVEDGSNSVWIGTESNGLFKYNTHSKELINPIIKGALVNYKDNIRTLFKDSQKNLWVCGDGGILKLNTQNNTLSEIIKTQPQISNIYSVCEENGEYLWLGSQKEGVYLINKSTGKYTRLGHSINNSNSLVTDVVWDVFKDNNNNLWIATDSGLEKYNVTKQEFTHYLTSKSVSCIYQNPQKSENTLWLGTFDLGLIKFDIQTASTEVFLQDPGVKHLSVNGITGFKDGLWIETNQGFIKFNTLTNSAETFTKNDQLLEDGYSLNAFYQTSDSLIFAGGNNGFTYFSPADAKKSAFIPTVLLTNFLLFNKKVVVNEESNGRVVLDSNITVKNNLILRYNDYIFSLEFSCNDYKNPENTEYAYILDGFEKNWNYTDSKRRFITYTNLKPGEYNLKIKSTNSDGVWFENSRVLHIEVLPPFWNTWWAYIVYLALVLGMLLLFRKIIQNRERFKNDLNQKVKNAEQQQEVEKMKLNFFTNVSHEFRTPLTLIQGPLEKLLEEAHDDKITKQLDIIGRNSKRLLNLINQILDFSKIDSGILKLNTVEDDIVLFTEKIFQAFENEAIRKSVLYRFNKKINTFYTAFDPDKYEKIVFNLLSNALKYSKEGGNIELNLHLVEANNLPEKTHILHLSVVDNGIGISPDKIELVFNRFFQIEDGHGGTGIGLAYTRELVELYNGRIWVESKVGEGSAFFVEIPLKQAEGGSVPEESIIPNVEATAYLSQTKMPTLDTQHNISGATIVLAEDNRDMRNYIASSLSPDFKIIEAKNGKEAWLSIINSMPDIVISDVMMPEKDGLELCKQIKSNELTSHIPVILLTARSAEDNFVQGLIHGADFYISKPFSPKLLKAQVISMLNNRQILKERFLKKLDIDPAEFTSNQIDQEFYFRITNIIEKNIENTELSIDFICAEMAISRTHLYTKIKAISGQSSSDFIRIIRLKHAALLIKEGHKVTKVFSMVGFKTQPHFTRSFKEHFGVSPTDFAKK